MKRIPSAHSTPAERDRTADVRCPNPGCEDGTVYVVTYGGTLDGLRIAYEPDERPEPCDVCRGRGFVDVAPCDVCGLPTPDTTPEGMTGCTCDDPVRLAYLAHVGAVA